MGIVYSGDWLSFVKEALNLRTTFTTYRLLHSFLNTVDAEARERGEPKSMKVRIASRILSGRGHVFEREKLYLWGKKSNLWGLEESDGRFEAGAGQTSGATT